MAEINQYRQELKDRIISYAMPEFYKRGVKAVKMDEISQGLHVSKRTVYEIFGDKEELLLAGMMRQLEENRSKLENFAKTQAKNVIDIISYVYKLQMERNGMVGVLFYEEVHKMPRVVKFFQENHAHEREESVRFFEAGVKAHARESGSVRAPACVRVHRVRRNRHVPLWIAGPMPKRD